jgi:hypothetical protein
MEAAPVRGVYGAASKLRYQKRREVLMVDECGGVPRLNVQPVSQGRTHNGLLIVKRR